MKHSTETARSYHHLALINIEYIEGLHRQKRFVQLRDLLNILHRDSVQFRVGKDPSAIHRHFLYATATVASLCKPHEFAADYRRPDTVPRSALQSENCKHAIATGFTSRRAQNGALQLLGAWSSFSPKSSENRSNKSMAQSPASGGVHCHDSTYARAGSTDKGDLPRPGRQRVLHL